MQTQNQKNLKIIEIMMYGSTGNVGSRHPSGGGAANPTTIAYPLLHHHELHHTFMIPLQPSPALPPFVGGADEDEFPIRDERFPQWSNQETRDLIDSRARLEWAFTAANNHGNWWEVVADRMRVQGYRMTADHCKCKWTNLVDRYMGQEAYDVDNVPPFFNELHAVFTARANRMQQQSHVEAETVVVRGKRLKDSSEDQSYEEFTQEQEEDKDVEVNHQTIKGRAVPKRKAKRQKILPLSSVNKNVSVVNGLQEIMRNFVQQQQRIEMDWRESMEKRAEEREQFEQEWRQKMENLERERLMMEQAWREREEERRVREEMRAEKRDALLSALLNKLIHEETT